MEFSFTRTLRLGYRLATTSFFVALATHTYAQTEVETARKYAINNAVRQQLTAADLEGMLVTDAYRSPTTGWYHVYFNQTVESVEVYNRQLNVVLVENQPVHLTHNFIGAAASLPVSSLTRSRLSPFDALQKIAAHLGLAALSGGQVQALSGTQLPDGLVRKTVFSAPALSNENIPVKLYWLPVKIAPKGQAVVQKLTLTWQVQFLTKDGQHGWNIHVDAVSGEVLQTTDALISCNFGTPQHTAAPHVCQQQSTGKSAAQPAHFGMSRGLFAPNDYTVFDYPLEAPTFGERTVVASPYTRFVPGGTGPGPTNGWHTDGTTSYTITRGNNVWASEDVNNDNVPGFSPGSATLDFNSSYTLGLGTAAANQEAAITNLFYWNNLIHDVLWKFGFDEPGGNFQTNNLGRGGAGNDFVYADAQDGKSTNNANFFTPADGTSGRMQMYLWNFPTTYLADSDFDNGIIAHEYGHGWSIRLTGGPANSDCLGNVEQGGEGWSDYLALMLTTNWSSLSANVASANIPRGIGTYVLGQPTTGAGIRPYRYSYDKANINNPVTYAQVGNTSFSQPHGIGSIWATMLWDMTWEIIMQDNQIEANIYTIPASVSAMRGNVAALKLVNEGLRLQPCSPSFVDARNAILQADQLLFGGRYRCAIGRAFARRGLGANASTGASSDDRLVTEDYTPLPATPLTSALSTLACSGTLFTYTATAGATGVTYSWARPVVAGISNASATGSSAVASETLINTTLSPITVQYSFSISPDACGTPVPQRVSVVVNPLVVPSVASYSVCQNGIVPVGEGLVAPVLTSNVASGSIAVGTTYRRSEGNNVTTYALGSLVYFQSFTFTAPASGTQTFEVTAATLNDNSGDTYMALYQNSFNPASAASNFLRGDDDSGTNLRSKFTHNLTAGTTYVLVISSYYSNVTGPFTVQVTAPVFVRAPNWFAVATGGASLTASGVFNPVGLAGSGIANTATPGTTPFYVASSSAPACRNTITFTVQPTPAAPTVTISETIVRGTSISMTATCNTTNAALNWYRTADNVPVTMPVSPTATTQYSARCELTATSATCAGPLNTVTVTVVAPTSFDSSTSGNWNSPGTWLCNCIPDGTLPVHILNTHTVTLPDAYTGQAKGVRFTGSGRVTMQGTGKVTMN